MFSCVRANTYVALRLPPGTHKIVKIVPDTTINLGKYGSFSSNSLLSRPYYLTFELLENPGPTASSSKGADAAKQLRLVTPSELHAEALVEDSTPSESRDDVAVPSQEAAAAADVDRILKNNRLTVDDPTRQSLTFAEIEDLKRQSTGSGRDIIAKILESHTALGEKTAFSLAKYSLRKSKKYLRRFTVLPLDVSLLAKWLLHERAASRILELREEVLGLLCSWSNVHRSRFNIQIDASSPSNEPVGRWLVVDDTGGLVVAALAERMDILHKFDEDEESSEEECVGGAVDPMDNDNIPPESAMSTHDQGTVKPKRNKWPEPATSDTITVLHSAPGQPNLNLLTYFGYDASTTPPTPLDHPLAKHLFALPLHHLTAPSNSTFLQDLPTHSEQELSEMKPSKRGQYFRKRRRHQRIKQVAEQTMAGGFDGLVVASSLDAVSVLRHTVHLVKGGGRIVVYSDDIGKGAELMDVYSSARRAAFVQAVSSKAGTETENQTVDLETDESLSERLAQDLLQDRKSDFPVDPRLLLSPTLQYVRANDWQVLPGRTHPLMTDLGGADGYLFCASRVLPVEGKKVEARGLEAGAKRKKRRLEAEAEAATTV